MKPAVERPAGIVFFDGHCNLCNGFVRFIIARDRAGRFRFAPLRSDFARDHFARHGWDPAGLDTVVFHAGDRFHVMSDAALEIAAGLPPPWSWARPLRVLPRGLRDAVYRWVARHRYRLFGRRETCRLPTPEEAARFLG
jgi:predicted DCC family thiol-disulfide oxidoreductase YuxK